MRKIFIVLTALALSAGFSMPVAAQSEVTFGGWVAFETWGHKSRLEALDLDGDGLFDDGRYTYTNTQWQTDTACSRFNVTFKRKNFKGFVEIRPRPGNDVGFRQWNAEWSFGPGFLLIGQTLRPTYSPITTSAAGFSAGYLSVIAGDTRSARALRPMIRLRFPFSAGEFQLAFLDPDGPRRVGNPGDVTNRRLPLLESRINVNFGQVGVNLFGNWHRYKEVFEDLAGLNTVNKTEISIKSWVVGSNISFRHGPFTLALAGFTGRNCNAGNGFFNNQTHRGLLNPVIVDLSGDGLWDSVHDTKERGAYINATFKLNEMLSFGAGGGVMRQTRDDHRVGPTDNDQQRRGASHMFINSVITVAQGFTITPEIGVFNHKTATLDDFVNQDLGKDTYYGIWWRMFF